MNSTIIEKSIRIQAPAARVWTILTEDKYTRDWYSAFSEGSHAITDWKEGSKAIFTDSKDCGMIGRVTDNKPHKLLSLTYEGVYADGKEDYTSEDARQIKGGREIYRLTEEDGATTLSIAQDMAESYLGFMLPAWDQALDRIRELSENDH